MKDNSRKNYRIKELAELSGVSVRTLRFYDEIGLFKPSFYGDNGYRFYKKDQLLILQQILFYRELGLELAQIQKFMSDPGFDKIQALKTDLENGRPVEDPVVQKKIRNHYEVVSRFWSPNRESYIALGLNYCDFPDFRKHFDSHHPKLAEYLAQAMKVFAERELTSTKSSSPKPS